MSKEKIQFSPSEDTISTKVFDLVVHNDDFNTFDFVIETLIEVCDHNPEQAEQCTLIIHHKGKCSVKSGEYSYLEPLCSTILGRGISATIE
jgi:ATP-dependent Clp protease adaptor protein ClpS